MKLRQLLKEASYPGNVGAMEVFQFYKEATPEEKEMFDHYLDTGNNDAAWELIQDVTGVQLHPRGKVDEMEENRATVFSDPITSIVIKRTTKEYTVKVLKAKITEKGWDFLVDLPRNNQVWHYNQSTNKIHHTFGKRDNHVRFIGELVEIQRSERKTA